MPVVLGIAFRMLKVDFVPLRVLIVDLPSNIERLVVAAVRGEQAPAEERNVDLRDEHDAVVVARAHEHVIAFHKLLEPNKSLRLRQGTRLAGNCEYLHMRHIDFLKRLLFGLLDNFAV